MSLRPRQIVSQFLSECHICINGDAPHDIHGFGEAYMDGWWDAQDIALHNM
jgi:hypothetical protein